ncbi:uncharacterized protein N7469_010578 [Penicillium citrinum]|uniref:Uncharacterized protein n=1 Tax=Penicillium citrinum TaxID=5077 RepID=A0A9W9TGA5_PENCI|nr:uncharacterized protein N7469_010578 [Penicillium citrinum]KAJ5221691.1 hypothetical protein N7469_010578 [Penicillium citrinum]
MTSSAMHICARPRFLIPVEPCRMDFLCPFQCAAPSFVVAGVDVVAMWFARAKDAVWPQEQGNAYVVPDTVREENPARRAYLEKRKRGRKRKRKRKEKRGSSSVSVSTPPLYSWGPAVARQWSRTSLSVQHVSDRLSGSMLCWAQIVRPGLEQLKPC